MVKACAPEDRTDRYYLNVAQHRTDRYHRGMPVEKGSSIDPARTRATVVEMAGPILYERGIDGIGVSELCTRLGISKETLYRHFATKDGLVVTVLEERSARVLRWLAGSIAAAGGDPFDEVAAAFDALAEWYSAPGFRGCALLNAAAQHHDPAVRDVVARHLDGYLDLFIGIARRAGATDARTLAVQLLILVEGTTVVTDHHAHARASKAACQAAETLLKAALPTTPRPARPSSSEQSSRIGFGSDQAAIAETAPINPGAARQATSAPQPVGDLDSRNSKGQSPTSDHTDATSDRPEPGSSRKPRSRALGSLATHEPRN